MKKGSFVFGKENYKLLGGGAILVLIGFLLMIGGASENPNEFNGDELFSFRRITLAPALVVAGYVVIILGIMKKKRVQK